MIVLVRWCCNANCHSVGRVPSSYPRGVRRPTALLCFYPMPFRSVTSVSLGSVRFGLLVSRSSSMSLVSLLFASQCAAWSRFRFPPPFMFIYCSKVFCLAFFRGLRFTSLSLSFSPACSLSFLFPLLRCTSLGSLFVRFTLSLWLGIALACTVPSVCYSIPHSARVITW